MAENNNTLLEKLDGLVARFEEGFHPHYRP